MTATVTTGTTQGVRTVVLTATHDTYSIVEHMSPNLARQRAAELLAAAGRAERPAPGSEFPRKAHA